VLKKNLKIIHVGILLYEIKTLFLLFILFTQSVFANDFLGCGEYLIKGILRQDKSLKNFFYYSVLEQTQSEIKFTFKKTEDLGLILVMLNKPITI
jgi:hypothetical protein